MGFNINTYAPYHLSTLTPSRLLKNKEQALNGMEHLRWRCDIFTFRVWYFTFYILIFLETNHGSSTPRGIPYRQNQIHFTNFLYLILCGWSTPNRFFLFSSYSLKPPSNQKTCESLSKARICVQTLSKNYGFGFVGVQKKRAWNAMTTKAQWIFSRAYLKNFLSVLKIGD